MVSGRYVLGEDKHLSAQAMALHSARATHLSALSVSFLKFECPSFSGRWVRAHTLPPALHLNDAHDPNVTCLIKGGGKLGAVGGRQRGKG